MMNRQWAALAVVSLLGVFSTSAAKAADASGCVALSERALSEVKQQKLLSARATLADCTAPACPEIVRASCQRRLGEVNLAIPTVVFEAKDEADNDVPLLSVTVDGVRFDDHVDGAALPLDPGPHEIRVETKGGAAEKSIVLREGDRGRHERIILPQGRSSRGGARVETTGQADSSAPRPSATFWTPLHSTGVAFGAVGLAGAAAGGIFGAIALSDRAQIKCDASNYCPAGDLHNLKVQTTLSTVSLAVGGALVAAGMTLMLVSPNSGGPRVDVAPTVSERSGGITLLGAF